MNTKRISVRVLAGLTLLAGVAGRGAADPKADEVLARKPVQPNVQVSTPTGADAAGCRAEQIKWPTQQNVTPTGIVVKDGQGRVVRQFIDTTGRNQPNIFSFYLNGVEAYRETDTKGTGKPDTFRWLGPNGGKTGEDRNGDGVIDVWTGLSAEELSQELFHAVASKDAARLAALLPREDELKAAGLPAAEAAKFAQRAAGAGKRLADTADALKLAAGAKWVHVEFGLPHTTPGDVIGSPADLVVHKNATVLIDKGDGKSVEVFQTGEMVQLGKVWKLIDGPATGAAAPGGEVPGQPAFDPKLQPLIAKLDQIPPPKTPAEAPEYHLKRAEVLGEIVAATAGEAQVPWLKQVIDAYAASAEAGHPKALGILAAWKEQIDKAAAGSPSAAYAGFRLLSADYSVRLREPADQDKMLKVQGWWREQLEAFLKANPKAEDAPEAMLRLAVAYEIAGKDGEPQAKAWYGKLADSFPGHTYAAKAQGAIARLGSDGQPFALEGATLEGKPFDVKQLAGKVVVVHYWASWSRDLAGEFKMLADLHKTYGPKGLEIVTVSLDETAQAAQQAVSAAQLPGTHLHAPGGLDKSPLATRYGIMIVPHAMVIDKAGKVASKNAQTAQVLKDEIERATR